MNGVKKTNKSFSLSDRIIIIFSSNNAHARKNSWIGCENETVYENKRFIGVFSFLRIFLIFLFFDAFPIVREAKRASRRIRDVSIAKLGRRTSRDTMLAFGEFSQEGNTWRRITPIISIAKLDRGAILSQIFTRRITIRHTLSQLPKITEWPSFSPKPSGVSLI